MRGDAAYAVWIVFVAAFVLLDAAARAWRQGLCTLGDLLGALVATREGKILVLIGWVWLGWHLFVRTAEVT